MIMRSSARLIAPVGTSGQYDDLPSTGTCSSGRFGLVVMCSGTHGQVPRSLPADVTAAYRHALPLTLTLLGETLTGPQNQQTAQCLLAAAAALKGHPALGESIDNLGLLTRCRNCGGLIPR